MTKIEDQISYSCNCIGPQNGEPFCPCMMRAKKVTIKNGRYVVPEQDLDAAREEGRRMGLEEGIAQGMKIAISVSIEKVPAAIRALIDKPADPVAEAAKLLADHIDSDMNAANAMIEAYTKVTMDTPVRHWLSQCLRVLAQKEGE